MVSGDSTQGGTLVLQELGAVVSLPTCHPVCDTHYTVINTQLSFLKKNSKKFLKKRKKLVGRKPSGRGAATCHSALGTGSLYTPRMEAHPLSSTVSFELSGLESYHLLPWPACAGGCTRCCVLGPNHPAAGFVVYGSTAAHTQWNPTNLHLPLLAVAVRASLFLDKRQM